MKKTKETKKSIKIDDETYVILKNKQSELITKTGQFVRMSELAEMSIQKVINDIHIKGNKDGWILTTEPPYEIDTVEHDIEIKRKVDIEKRVEELREKYKKEGLPEGRVLSAFLDEPQVLTAKEGKLINLTDLKIKQQLKEE